MNKNRYFEIIGAYTKKVIGVCSDIRDVLREEPDATFAEISKEKFESYEDNPWGKSIGEPVEIEIETKLLIKKKGGKL